MPIKPKNAKIRKQIETKEYLDSVLSYNPKTGELIWKSWYRKGQIAGGKNKEGYIILSMGGAKYGLRFKAHRLAWIMYYGFAPHWKIHVDHINGNRDDNRICNLRLCNSQLNVANSKLSKNNSTGFKGVAKLLKKYRAYICYRRKQIHLGCYDTPEKAHQAYLAKAKELFGEYHNPG